jgi:hypothetical protein
MKNKKTSRSGAEGAREGRMVGGGEREKREAGAGAERTYGKMELEDLIIGRGEVVALHHHLQVLCEVLAQQQRRQASCSRVCACTHSVAMMQPRLLHHVLLLLLLV